MKHKRTRNPYGNTKKRKAALAWLAAKGITQPRPLYPEPMVKLSDIGVEVTVGPMTAGGPPRDIRKLRLI